MALISINLSFEGATYDGTAGAPIVLAPSEGSPDGFPYLVQVTLISLETDRRDANADDQRDKRGWWADGIVEGDDVTLGSYLWTLDTEAVNARTVRLAREYAEAALEWMTETGLAASVTATSERIGLDGIGVAVEITQPVPPSGIQFVDEVWQELSEVLGG